MDEDRSLPVDILEARRVAAFVSEKVRRGVISREDANEITSAFTGFLHRQGYSETEEMRQALANRAFAPRGVVRQAIRLMKQKLFDLYAELEEEALHFTRGGRSR
jgi:hypothetical protein